jgi:hypothetical protein
MATEKKHPHKKKSLIHSSIERAETHIESVRKSLDNVFQFQKQLEDARSRKRWRVAVSTVVLLFILGVFISPHGKAEVATFYPTSCLGGWTNPHNAEGRPETVDAAPNFNDENAAFLAKDVLADLYCGVFKGEIPTDTRPTKMKITIAWKGMQIEQVNQMSGESFASSSLEILDATSTTNFTATTTATSTDKEASSTLQSLGTLLRVAFLRGFEHVDAQEDTSAPSDTTAPPAATSDTTTDAPPTEVAPPSLSEEHATSTTEENVSGTPLDAATTTQTETSSSTSISENASTTDVMTSSTTASTTDPVLLQNNFVPNPVLEVLYTFDGQNWLSLGKVSAEDLSYNSFEVPFDPRATWEDISNIQIKINSIVTPDAKPDIYVDGIVLEVEYGKKDPVQPGEKSDPKRYQMIINQVVGSTTFEMYDDPDQGNVLMVSIADGGTLLIYNDTNGGIIFSSGLGGDPLPVPAYNFEPGSFTALVTGRKDACEKLSKEECLEDAIGAASVTVRPTPDTPLKYIHTQ